MPSILVAELDARKFQDRFLTIDDLNATTGWTVAGAGATVTQDLVNYVTAGIGIKLTVPASIAGSITKATGGGLNLTGITIHDEIRFWVIVDNASRVASASIQFVDDAGSPVTATHALTGLVNGFNRFSLPKSAFTNGGTIDWSGITSIKFNVTATAGGTVNATFDMLRMMYGPNIGYTNGVWDESHAVADFIDGRLYFFDTGYWQLTDVRLRPTDFYRVDAEMS